MKEPDNVYDSFGSWLVSQREWAEKTIGVVVLAVETIALFSHVFSDLSRQVLTQLLNFLFLIFVYFYLRDDFARRYIVDADDPEVARILRFSASVKNSPSSRKKRTNTPEEKEKISQLVADANTLIFATQEH